MTIETILTERESKIATALFEIIRPQIEKMIDAKLDSFKESEITSLLDISLKKDFDIYDYTSDIEEMIGDWIQYNLTLTTTVD